MQTVEGPAAARGPGFAMALEIDALDLRSSWRRCNMLANYIAEYVAYQYPQREWAENLISTVANEFLESIAQVLPEDGRLHVACEQGEGELRFSLTYPVRAELADSYPAFLAELRGPRVDELYFEHLTSGERPSPAFNQLGLLMLAHDFGVLVEPRWDGPRRTAATSIRVPTGEIAR